MKLAIKKTYCPSYCRLVWGIEQKKMATLLSSAHFVVGFMGLGWLCPEQQQEG